LIKLTHRADYLKIGCEIMLESEDVLVSNLKNNCEIVCHYWLKGGGPKGIGTSSSDEDEEEEENDQYDEEEQLMENIPEAMDQYELYFGDHILDPEEWTGWMRYDSRCMEVIYDMDEREMKIFHDDYLRDARIEVEDKIRKWWSKEKFEHDKYSNFYEASVEETIMAGFAI
jgi:hypothetical protein